eukprot:2749528-Rhodomonas_salina.1
MGPASASGPPCSVGGSTGSSAAGACSSLRPTVCRGACIIASRTCWLCGSSSPSCACTQPAPCRSALCHEALRRNSGATSSKTVRASGHARKTLVSSGRAASTTRTTLLTFAMAPCVKSCSESSIVSGTPG